MKCFWGAGHHRWKLKFLGAWLLPCQYPWLLPWISAWSLMPWVLPCHKTSGSMAFAMQPSMVFITTSTTPHLYKACWGWKSESYINSISVDLLRVDWKKKKRISRLPTAERRGWALVHSSFVAPLDCFTPELVERSKIGKTDGNRRTWYLGLGRYVMSGIKFLCAIFWILGDVCGKIDADVPRPYCDDAKRILRRHTIYWVCRLYLWIF